MVLGCRKNVWLVVYAMTEAIVSILCITAASLRLNPYTLQYEYIASEFAID